MYEEARRRTRGDDERRDERTYEETRRRRRRTRRDDDDDVRDETMRREYVREEETTRRDDETAETRRRGDEGDRTRRWSPKPVMLGKTTVELRPPIVVVVVRGPRRGRVVSARAMDKSGTHRPSYETKNGINDDGTRLEMRLEGRREDDGGTTDETRR
jgi:hypothetical protein